MYVSPVWWPGMARKVSMEFEMAFNHKFLPALEDAEKLMNDLDLDNACNKMYVCVYVLHVCMFVCMYYVYMSFPYMYVCINMNE